MAGAASDRRAGGRRAWNRRCWRARARRCFEAARKRRMARGADRLWRALALARTTRFDTRPRCARAYAGAAFAPGEAAGGFAARGFSREVAMEVLARGAVHLAVSEFVKSVLVTGGVSAEKIAVVYDGVPVLEQAHGRGVMSPARKSGAGRGSRADSRRHAEVLGRSGRAICRAPPCFVYITRKRRAGLGRAAGDVGRRTGDCEQGRRIAGDYSASARTECWWKIRPNPLRRRFAN